jgi:chemotaxis protein methyltransferase CheR
VSLQSTANSNSFFREARHFEHLRAVLEKRIADARPFRAWSAACSTGEEAYSIAMVLADVLPAQGWEVLASDISPRVLDTARRGRYPMARAAGIPPDFLPRFCLTGFEGESDTLLVSRALRECVEFAQINLNAPRLPTLGRFDAVFLRNVLGYFDGETGRRVIRRVLDHLRPGGFMYIGESESLHGMAMPVHDLAPGIYRRANERL